MPKTITVKAVKEALSNLQKLSPANPKMDDDLDISVKEAVTFMAPELIKMSKRGFTNRELTKGLNDQGIFIKAGTLNRYLNEYLVANSSAEPDTALKSDDAKMKKSESPRFGKAKNLKSDEVATEKKSDPVLNSQEGPRV